MKIFFIIIMFFCSYWLAIASDIMEYQITGKCEHCLILDIGK